jgi:hypothetical protein
MTVYNVSIITIHRNCKEIYANNYYYGSILETEFNNFLKNCLMIQLDQNI